MLEDDDYSSNKNLPLYKVGSLIEFITNEFPNSEQEKERDTFVILEIIKRPGELVYLKLFCLTDHNLTCYDEVNEEILGDCYYRGTVVSY